MEKWVLTLVSHVGRSFPRLQTGQSEPMMTLSALKDSRVVSIHGSRVSVESAWERDAMIPEILQATLGSDASFFNEVAQVLKFSWLMEGPPQWSRTN